MCAAVRPVEARKTKLDVAKEVMKGMLDRLAPDDMGECCLAVHAGDAVYPCAAELAVAAVACCTRSSFLSSRVAPPGSLLPARPASVSISLFSDLTSTPKLLGRWGDADVAGIKAGIDQLQTVGCTNFQASREDLHRLGSTLWEAPFGKHRGFHCHESQRGCAADGGLHQLPGDATLECPLLWTGWGIDAARQP